MDQEVRCRLDCKGAADGRAVRWNSFFDCDEIESAPRSQWRARARYHGRGREVCSRALEDSSVDLPPAPAMDPGWECYVTERSTKEHERSWIFVERLAFVGLLSSCAKCDRGGRWRTCNDCVCQ